MAAGQQKRRSISSSLHEHYRGKKKKKVDSYDYVLNLRSQIYLEWDDSQKKAVSKREQIGLKWTDMAPFVYSVPHNRSGLADIIPVPDEIYSLDNLMDVLSYEVWAMCLSESDRKLLTQFLPSGTGAEQAVHSLLTGENHHFGNPFIKWSTSLCAGNLHPDDVLLRERQIRSTKKQYYSELNKYHTDMLGVLKKWKVKWSHCNDPEKLWRKELVKHKEGRLPSSTERAKVSPMSKKQVQQKVDIQNSDIAKYMSYIKVSKKQHETIKNLKNSGDGIQAKSLNHVLGDISDYHIHSYEAPEVEEKVRLHEHWLQVVKKDLPLAFEVRTDKKLQREELHRRLVEELNEKGTLNIDESDEDKPKGSSDEQIEDIEADHNPVELIIQENVVSASINSDHSHHPERVPSLNSHQELSLTSLDPAIGDTAVTTRFNEEEHLTKGFTESGSLPLPAKNMWKAVDSHKHGPSSDLYLRKCQSNDECQDTRTMFTNFPVISQFKVEEILENAEESKPSTLPVKDKCEVVDSHEYSSSSDFAYKKLQPVEEHRATIIDLERDVETGESDNALFSILPSFSKGPGMFPSYTPHEHLNHLKQPQLPFLMANGSLPGTMQFPHQFREQQGLIQQRIIREKDHPFVRPMMNKSIYSNGSNPNQDLTWFPDEQRYQNNNYWSGVETSTCGSQCLGDNNNSDGSLFSVLSECRNIPSQSSHSSMNSEQSMEARNYGSGNDGYYAYAPHQFKSSHEAAPANSTALWMNYQPQQNSSLQDSIGKPFLRSWNQ